MSIPLRLASVEPPQTRLAEARAEAGGRARLPADHRNLDLHMAGDDGQCVNAEPRLFNPCNSAKFATTAGSATTASTANNANNLGGVPAYGYQQSCSHGSILAFTQVPASASFSSTYTALSGGFSCGAGNLAKRGPARAGRFDRLLARPRGETVDIPREAHPRTPRCDSFYRGQGRPSQAPTGSHRIRTSAPLVERRRPSAQATGLRLALVARRQQEAGPLTRNPGWGQRGYVPTADLL